MTCKKCGRKHSGMCGIPPGVTLGFGARSPGSHSVRRPDFELKGKPGVRRPTSKGTLEGLLAWGQALEKQCLDLLKALPPASQEYVSVMERLDKAQSVLGQVRVQLAARGR